MNKVGKVVMAVSAMSVLFAQTVFAGTWRTGEAPNENRWWYEQDNGTYAKDGWQWIDGNQDGVAECYYFDSMGWMLANTTTSDGYTVNESGAWVQDGVIQTQAAQVPTEQAPAENAAQSMDFSWLFNADGTVNYDLMNADFGTWFAAMQTMYEQDGTIWEKPHETQIANWAQLSDRGAVWKAMFDYYGIPYDVGTDRNANVYTFTSRPGMTKADEIPIAAAIQMMIWTNTDGMCEAQGVSTLNADTTVTCELNLRFFG